MSKGVDRNAGLEQFHVMTTIDELAKVNGINKSLAEMIFNVLHRKTNTITHEKPSCMSRDVIPA